MTASKLYTVIACYEQDGAGVCLCIGCYATWDQAMNGLNYAMRRYEDRAELVVSIEYDGRRIFQVSDSGERAFADLDAHRAPARPRRVAA